MHNIIEQFFGVLKRQYQILQITLEYSIEIQAWIPCTLAAIHNFIQEHSENILEHKEELCKEQATGFVNPDDEASVHDAVSMMSHQHSEIASLLQCGKSMLHTLQNMRWKWKWR